MKKLPLRNREGKVIAHALVDDTDHRALRDQRWSLNSHGYVQGWNGTVCKLHRVLLGLSRGDGNVVDHINGNRLDNRRKNLRLVNVTINNRNLQRAQKNSISGALHVHPQIGKNGNLYGYQVRVKGHYIGFAKTLEEGEALAAKGREEIYGSDC